MKNLSCRKCGNCCRNIGKIRIHSSETQAIGHFTKAGAALKGPDAKAVYEFEGPECPHLSGKLCGIHLEKPLMCQAHPFVVKVDNATGEATIALWAGKCLGAKDRLLANWEAASREKAMISVRGRLVEEDAPKLALSLDEIDANPYLRKCFASATKYAESVYGDKFKKPSSIQVVIAEHPAPGKR